VKVRCTKRHKVDSDDYGRVREALPGDLGDVTTKLPGFGSPEDSDYHSVVWRRWERAVDRPGRRPWGFYTAAELAEVAEEVSE
jgi:hypothetical protein